MARSFPRAFVRVSSQPESHPLDMGLRQVPETAAKQRWRGSMYTDRPAVLGVRILRKPVRACSRRRGPGQVGVSGSTRFFPEGQRHLKNLRVPRRPEDTAPEPGRWRACLCGVAATLRLVGVRVWVRVWVGVLVGVRVGVRVWVGVRVRVRVGVLPCSLGAVWSHGDPPRPLSDDGPRPVGWRSLERLDPLPSTGVPSELGF